MSAFGGKADIAIAVLMTQTGHFRVKQTSHPRTREKEAKHPPGKHDKQRHDIQRYIVLWFSRIESLIKPKRRENNARPN